MVKIDESVMIDRPVEEVWKFMTDWSNFTKINPAILEAKQISLGSRGVGTTVEAKLRNPNIIEKDVNIQVIEYEPNRKLTLEHTSGATKGTKTIFTLETIEGKTKLTLATDAKLSGFFKLIGPFVVGRERREVNNMVNSIKRALESETKR